jgi:hypothetical protein
VTTDVDGASAIAQGETDFRGLNLADGALRLGRVHSVARATLGADGQVKVTSSLAVTGVSIMGVSVSVDAEGFEVAGTRVPLSQVKTALASAGLQLDYVHPQVDQDGRGVTAGGIVLTYLATPPAATGQEPITIVETIGRARARIDAAAVTGPPSVGQEPSVGPPDAVSEPIAPPPPVLLPDGAPGAVALPSPAPIPAVDAVTPTVRAAPVAQLDLLWLYVALIVACGLVSGSGLVFRLVRVQPQWI